MGFLLSFARNTRGRRPSGVAGDQESVMFCQGWLSVRNCLRFCIRRMVYRPICSDAVLAIPNGLRPRFWHTSFAHIVVKMTSIILHKSHGA
jgi:hypothetical protein